MLSRELMGLGALAILWLNTLLVAGAAIGAMRPLLARLRAMRHDGLWQGVARDGALAAHEVAQVGRKASDDAGRQAILFHDRSRASCVLTGRVQSRDGDFTVASGAPVDVWIAAAALARAAECPSPEQFDDAYALAAKARGFERIVRCEVCDGERVWIHGTLREGEHEITAPKNAPLLVATFDPARWCRGRVLLLAGFIAVILLAAAAVTLVALTPPLFGLTSTLGGAAGLAFFLSVQPAGVAARDAVRVPSSAYLRGSWVKSGSEGLGADRSAQQRTPVE